MISHLLINTVAVAIVLGVIVFVHELGHFVAAKSFGVRVETFSLGFGTRLFGFRRGDTDYRVSVLPLGGYVKMTGENPGEASGDPAEFQSKPRWQRFIIAGAGPAMNVVLAIGLLVPVYMKHFERNSVLSQPAVIAEVDPGSPAAQAGLKPLDRIVRIDSVENPTWEQVGVRSLLSADHPIPMAVLRNGQIVQTSITPRSSDSSDETTLGVNPVETVLVAAISPNSPAARAGIKPGDRLVQLDGKRLLNRSDLINALRSSGGNPVHLTLQRGNPPADISLSVTPEMMDAGAGEGKHWMIGASLGTETEVVKLPFGQALHESLKSNREYSVLIFDLLGRLISHRASASNLAGPIRIASITGEAARQPTFTPLFAVTALISLNLGIMNLLPIPVLDGGMILFLLVEAIIRRDVSKQVKERIYQVGFAFLILLMTFVVYNDIVHTVAH
jgi:regulator of sigma E protease